MIINTLRLKNFRNFSEYTVEFKPGFNIIIGPNAAGKTNILEAISVVSYGFSLRAKDQKDLSPANFLPSNKEEQIEKVTSVEAICKIKGVDRQLIWRAYFPTRTSVNLQTKQSERRFSIDNKRVSYSEFVGNFVTLFFSSSTIDLVANPPSAKRKFIDNILILLSKPYRDSLRKYRKALLHRNSILRKGKTSWLVQWTKILVEHGSLIIKARKAFFDRLNCILKNQKSNIQITYIPSVQLDAVFNEDPKVRFLSLLNDSLERDVSLKRTTIGPHLDNWIVVSTSGNCKKNLAKFGSRGEQRLAMLSIMSSLILLSEKVIGEPPVLLIDDIFSELDVQHQRQLVDRLLKLDCQVIASTTPNFIDTLKQSKITDIHSIELSLD